MRLFSKILIIQDYGGDKIDYFGPSIIFNLFSKMTKKEIEQFNRDIFVSFRSDIKPILKYQNLAERFNNAGLI